jgi:hypothetical protein
MDKKIVYITIVVLVAAFLYVLPGQVSGYESKGKRDPFIPLVGQEKAGNSAGLADIISVNDIILEGIASGPSGTSIAILNGQMVKENDKFGLLQIKNISKKTVEVSLDGVIYKLILKEE